MTPISSSSWPDDCREAYLSCLDINTTLQLLYSELSDDGSSSPDVLHQPPDTAALLNSGFLEMSNLPLDDFLPVEESAIHTIFKLDKWDSTGLDSQLIGKAYEIMRPALALATKFITHDEMLGWWIHTLYGQRCTDAATGRVFLADDPREQDVAQARQDVLESFNQLASSLRFYWLPNSDASMTSFNPYFALEALTNSQKCEEPRPQKDFLPVIGLSNIFHYHLLSPHGAHQASLCSNLRLQFHLAKEIVHELAHALYMFVHGDKYEPYHSLNDEMPECGFSWQRYVFGCDISLFPFRTSVTGPLCAMAFNQMHAFPSIWVPLSVRWVVQWFLESTWDELGLFWGREEMRPQLAHELPKRYDGLFYADRFVPETSLWARVLYAAGKPVSIQALNVPGSRSSKVQSGVRLKEVAPSKGVGAWFETIKARDVERAMAQGFEEDVFVFGRSSLYQQLCYDGKGDAS